VKKPSHGGWSGPLTHPFAHRNEDVVLSYRPFPEIVEQPGLRIVLVKGLPSPWGQAAKTIFEIKGLEYVAAPWLAGEPNAEIAAWGGEASAPIAAWAKEKPIHRIPADVSTCSTLCRKSTVRCRGSGARRSPLPIPSCGRRSTRCSWSIARESFASTSATRWNCREDEA
jgi:hypothetical protein